VWRSRLGFFSFSDDSRFAGSQKKKNSPQKKKRRHLHFTKRSEFVFLVLVFFLVSLLCSVERKREKE
jgi:hypothetical protein